MGGGTPVIGDNLYVPIVNEIAEATGLTLTDAVPYGESWSYRVPTSLVLLESDATDVGL